MFAKDGNEKLGVFPFVHPGSMALRTKNCAACKALPIGGGAVPWFEGAPQAAKSSRNFSSLRANPTAWNETKPFFHAWSPVPNTPEVAARKPTANVTYWELPDVPPLDDPPLEVPPLLGLLPLLVPPWVDPPLDELVELDEPEAPELVPPEVPEPELPEPDAPELPEPKPELLAPDEPDPPEPDPEEPELPEPSPELPPWLPEAPPL